jgi:hypothetical protein
VSAKSSEMNVMIPAGEDFVEQVTFYAFLFMSFLKHCSGFVYEPLPERTVT